MLGDVADPLHVGGGEHRQHAGHRLGGRGVDRADVREGMRGAHEIGLQLAGQRRVGHVAPEPAQQRIVLQAGLVRRATLDGLRIHDGFRMSGEGLCGSRLYSRDGGARESVLALKKGRRPGMTRANDLGMRMNQTRTAARVPAAAITGLIADALGSVGLPALDAAKVAELMTEADLTGADAHGVFRLPQYVRRLRAGGVNRTPDHHGDQDRGGDRAGRRRQRHGPPGDGARGRDRDRAGARKRHRLGRRAALEPCRLSRRLRGAAARARHDRHLLGGGERQPHGAVGRRRDACSAPIRWRSRSRPATRRRWCSTSPPRSSPTAPSSAYAHAGQADAGRLDGEPRGRPAAHRFRRTAPTACCSRSAATRAAGWRWCSACSPARSTAPPSGAT